MRSAACSTAAASPRSPPSSPRSWAAPPPSSSEETPEPSMPTAGKITQVIGSTFDAEFPEESLPRIYNALEATIERRDGAQRLVGEVQQHLGGGRVRAVALGSTDGMVRGQE